MQPQADSILCFILWDHLSFTQDLLIQWQVVARCDCICNLFFFIIQNSVLFLLRPQEKKVFSYVHPIPTLPWDQKAKGTCLQTTASQKNLLLPWSNMDPQCLGTIVPWQTETLLLGADRAVLVLKHTRWRSIYSLLTSELRFSETSNTVFFSLLRNKSSISLQYMFQMPVVWL